MDQTLQARLIGATVLVALAVLLIPELLSGRKSVEPAVDEGAAAKGTRSFTIELGTPDGQTSVAPAPPAPSTVAPASRAPAAPAGSAGAAEETPGPVAGVESTQVMPAPGLARSPPPERTAEPQPVTAAPARPAPSPPPEPAKTGGWAVQVGAFGSADAARRLVDELSAAGFEAHLAPVTRSGKTLHRVRVGPAATRPAADQLAQRLKARGLPASVVAND
jgi:cell division septation protein DedD